MLTTEKCFDGLVLSEVSSSVLLVIFQRRIGSRAEKSFDSVLHLFRAEMTTPGKDVQGSRATIIRHVAVSLGVKQAAHDCNTAANEAAV